jgi:hypothetical protein
LICQVIISDYVAERRLIFVLDQHDFAAQRQRWQQPDDVLTMCTGHPFFAGCTDWATLEIKHFHALIVNVVSLCGEQTAQAINERTHPLVARLLFLLCSLISVLESRTGSTIDVLRLNRVRADDVLYEYSARLDVLMAPPPHSTLRVVIDNQFEE